jgi:hypothetical protein
MRPGKSVSSVVRRLLGDELALPVDEGHSAVLLAELGAGAAPRTSTEIEWRLRNAENAIKKIGPALPRPATWKRLEEAWTDRLARSTSRRIVLERLDIARELSRRDLRDVVDVLREPAVGAASVVLALPRLGRELPWQWPIRVGAFPDDFEALGLEKLEHLWPANKLSTLAKVDRDHARMDVLVMCADPRGALARLLVQPHRVRASLVLLVNTADVAWSAQLEHLDAVLAELLGGGASLWTVPRAAVHQRINEWIRELSHKEPIDVALAKAADVRSVVTFLDDALVKAASLPVAARKVAARLVELPTSAPFEVEPTAARRVNLGWVPELGARALGLELAGAAGSLPADQESMLGAAMSEIGEAARAAERAVEAGAPPRHLQGQLLRREREGDREANGLVCGAPYALVLWIDEGALAPLTHPEAFPEGEIEWVDDQPVELDVLFSEPSQWDEAMWGVIELRRRGKSSECRFEFTPTTPGAFQGRVILHHRGRVLQTALLTTEVGRAGTKSEDGARFAVEAEIRASLGGVTERRAFDAFLVCNHTGRRKAAITAAANKVDGGYVTSLDKLDHAITKISERLTEAAHAAAEHSKGLNAKVNGELLSDLARCGNILYRAIVLDQLDRNDKVAAKLRDATHLQVLTMEPDALVPLEFVYDYPPVRKAGAPVCKNARQVLLDGASECPATCKPDRSPAAHVCPMGFWGMRKVIERHIHVPSLKKESKVVRVDPNVGRDTLDLRGATLAAISKEVPAKKRKALHDAVARYGKRRGKVTAVKTWDEWREAVQTSKPTMLIVLPHVDGVDPDITLEIEGDELEALLIDEGYVRAGPTAAPLTILFGCDTANRANASAWLSPVSVFRQAQSAIVVATIATVFGEDAARVTETLLESMQELLRPEEPQRFGEALLRAKRLAVADSKMVALALVAFGDADWTLTA